MKPRYIIETARMRHYVKDTETDLIVCFCGDFNSAELVAEALEICHKFYHEPLNKAVKEISKF